MAEWAERPISGEQIRAELEELISQERDKIAARFHRKVPIGVLLPAAEYLRLSATLRLADHEPMNHHHWMNAVGVILEWYGGGQLIDADGFPTGDDIARLVILAAQQHEILNMVDGIDAGVYRALKAELPGPRRGYRLQHLAPRIEAARYRLAESRYRRAAYRQRAVAASTDFLDPTMEEQLGDILDGSRSNWTEWSATHTAFAKAVTLQMAAEYPDPVPLDTRVAGIAFGSALHLFAVLSSLVAIYDLGQLRTGLDPSQTVIGWKDAASLSKWLHNHTDEPRATCDRFVELMIGDTATFDHQRPRPLLRTGELVLAPGSLVLGFNLPRNLLAFWGAGGTSGRLQGEVGEATVASAFGGSALRVERQVYLQRLDGSLDLDLDVVVYNEEDRVGLALSVFTPVAPDGYREDNHAARRCLRKQDDLRRAHHELMAGGLRFARNHRRRMQQQREGTWTWMVIGPHVVPFDQRVRDHDIPYISFEALQDLADTMIRPQRLSTLIPQMKTWMVNAAARTPHSVKRATYSFPTWSFVFDEIHPEHEREDLLHPVMGMLQDFHQSFGAAAYTFQFHDDHGVALPRPIVTRIDAEVLRKSGIAQEPHQGETA